MSVCVELWGRWALFSRPEMKTERVSYDVITPSAARGILEAVYWHPGMKYRIDRIHVLSPIRFTNIRRNEVSEKALGSAVRSMAQGGPEVFIATKDCIQQRAAMMLTNVHYVIEAHFDLTDKALPADNAGKFQDILKRRLRRGAYYSQPYFGTRECTAHAALWEGREIPNLHETRDLGWMLYDMDYTDSQDIRPMFFRAKMVDGVIDLTNCGVVQ